MVGSGFDPALEVKLRVFFSFEATTTAAAAAAVAAAAAAAAAFISQHQWPQSSSPPLPIVVSRAPLRFPKNPSSFLVPTFVYHDARNRTWL